MVEAIARQGDDRHVEVHRDVLGSAIVSGDGNKVYIYHYTLEQQQQAPPPQSVEVGPNPYRGLAAFQVEDADLFFGREAQVDRLWKRLRDLHEQAATQEPPIRILPVLGPSGSGKSSLARAGLLPELARRPLPAHQEMRVVVVKPGATPLEALAVVLARIVTNNPSPVEKAAEFERVLKRKDDDGTYSGLRRITNSFPGIDTSPLIILVDQFEETYSLCKEVEAQVAFIENLIVAARSAEAYVSVILTLRTDFLSRTQKHRVLNRVICSDQSVIVPAMEEEELRRAISEPATRAGHPLDEATINLLIEQTEGREGALPLLQFALTRIWEGMTEGRAPAQTLEAIGGVGGALAEEAQRIFEKLNNNEKDIARRIFIGLVQLGEGARDTRRRAKVEGLRAAGDDPQQFQRVLDRFSAPGTRLITLSSISGQEMAEVAHEALFDNWTQLKTWLDSYRDLIRQQRRIEAAAEEWKQKGKSGGYLLYGRQLADVRKFHKKHAQDLPLSSLAEELIHSSWKVALWSRGSLLFMPIYFFLAYLFSLADPFSIREQEAREDYLVLENNDRFGQREALLSLVEGCRVLGRLPLFMVRGGEPIFGKCRKLVGYDLSKAQLKDARLVAANLERINLSGANLTRADLRGANIRGADLRGANLSGADLSGADLSGVDFRGADLSRVDFRGANLCKTILPKGIKLNPDRDCKASGYE